MFSSVKFTWAENQNVSFEARRLWVKTVGGNVALMTFAELCDMVGEVECRRLVKVAVRRGCGKWHRANAKAVLLAA